MSLKFIQNFTIHTIHVHSVSSEQCANKFERKIEHLPTYLATIWEYFPDEFLFKQQCKRFLLRILFRSLLLLFFKNHFWNVYYCITHNFITIVECLLWKLWTFPSEILRAWSWAHWNIEYQTSRMLTTAPKQKRTRKEKNFFAKSSNNSFVKFS